MTVPVQLKLDGVPGEFSSVAGWLAGLTSYLQWVVRVLQTEGNVVEMFVGHGTVRNSPNIVFVNWRTPCKYVARVEM